MSATSTAMRTAFRVATVCYAKVTPEGFRLVPQDRKQSPETCTRLTGRIGKTRLMRKLFQGATVQCQSRDGRTSENGKSCQACQHPLCRPWLQMQLVQPDRTCILELNVSSANNFFEFEDNAAAQGHQIQDWTVILTVTNHDHWGEVCFERSPDIAPPHK